MRGLSPFFQPEPVMSTRPPTQVSLNPNADDGLRYLRINGDAYLLGACALVLLVVLAVGQQYGQLGVALGWGLPLCLAAGGCFLMARGSWLNSVVLPMLLASLIALQIHLGGGNLEYHFGVFVAIALMLVYRHWLPVVVMAATFAVHHVLFDRLQAAGLGLFCLSRPDFAQILGHATYVVVQTVFEVFTVIKMRRDARLMAELNTITEVLVGTRARSTSPPFRCR